MFLPEHSFIKYINNNNNNNTYYTHILNKLLLINKNSIYPFSCKAFPNSFISTFSI